MDRTPAARLGFIDGLRGVAVLLVFGVHAPELFRSVAGGGQWLYHAGYALNAGRMGVIVFFAISGYVIPFSLEKPSARPLAAFGISRFFRLFPAFSLSVPLSAWWQYWVWEGQQHLTFRDAALNLTMVPRWWGVKMANGAYWTLEAELVFYALAAGLFAATRLRNTGAIAALALALAAASGTQLWHLAPRLTATGPGAETMLLFLHLSIMLWGTLLRCFTRPQPPGALALFGFAAYSYCYLVQLPGDQAGSLLHHFHEGTARQLAGYGGALWIFALTALFRPRFPAVLCALGRISYSFYLLHGPSLYCVLWLVQRFHVLGWRLEAYCLAAFALAVGLASVSYGLVEKPSVAAGHALARRLHGPRPARMAGMA